METGVRLRHGPSGVEAEASERRSGAENLKLATRRLRLTLAVEVRAKLGRHPTALWRERCQGGQISISSQHEQFPAVLSEAMDALEAHDWDAKVSSRWLGCSMTQLVKLLRRWSPALQQLHDQRRKRGLARLR